METERSEGEAQFEGTQLENLFERTERSLEALRRKGIEIPDVEIDRVLVVRDDRLYLSRDDTARLTGLTYSTLRK